MSGELLKANLNTLAEVLTDLFRTTGEKDAIPDDKGLIVKLQKKGNLQNCGITLPSIPS